MIDDVGTGDDRVPGNALGNVLAGADTIYGGEGNDQIEELDGSPDDTVDCGENLIGDAYNDSVLYDLGDDIDFTNGEDTSTQP